MRIRHSSCKFKPVVQFLCLGCELRRGKRGRVVLQLRTISNAIRTKFSFRCVFSFLFVSLLTLFQVWPKTTGNNCKVNSGAERMGKSTPLYKEYNHKNRRHIDIHTCNLQDKVPQ